MLPSFFAKKGEGLHHPVIKKIHGWVVRRDGMQNYRTFWLHKHLLGKAAGVPEGQSNRTRWGAGGELGGVNV